MLLSKPALLNDHQLIGVSHTFSFTYDHFHGGSDGKVSACNVGDLGSIPGSGRSPGEGNGNSLQYSCHHPPKKRGAQKILSFLGGSDSKVSAHNAGDLGSIPGSGRSRAEGNGNPLQYSCLENSMN